MFDKKRVSTCTRIYLEFENFHKKKGTHLKTKYRYKDKRIIRINQNNLCDNKR